MGRFETYFDPHIADGGDPDLRYAWQLYASATAAEVDRLARQGDKVAQRVALDLPAAFKRAAREWPDLHDPIIRAMYQATNQHVTDDHSALRVAFAANNKTAARLALAKMFGPTFDRFGRLHVAKHGRF